LNITIDNRILIPAAGMHSIEADVQKNDKVKLTLGSKEVQGKFSMGTGFRIEGTANFLIKGSDFEMMKEKFSFLSRVLEVRVSSVIQTL
jgi:hypothetical protein